MAGDVAASIRVQALDGTWEAIGVDRLSDIEFSDLTMSANGYGPDKASFSLKRQPGNAWPDVSAFTPVEIEVGGVQVWSGRVIEAPSKEGDSYGLSVQCEGWQYSLDDDLYRRQYVDVTLSDWKDTRQFIDCELTVGRRASGQVAQEDGALVLSFPKGSDVQNLQIASVGLDLGPEASGSNKHLAVYMEYDWINAGGNANQFVFGQTNASAAAAPWVSGSPATFLFAINNGAATTSGLVATALIYGEHRFIEIGIQSLAGSAMTNAADTMLRIKTLRVFPWAYGYGTGRRSFFISSCLRATEVALDAASYATKVSLPSAWQDLGCSPQYDAAVLADDPTFYLPMSEGSGNAVDVVRGGTYAYTASPTQSATGGGLQESAPIYANGYADFNGTTQYLTGPSQTLYGPQGSVATSPTYGICCEALVYPTTNAGTRQIARQSTGSTNWFLRQNAGVWEIGAWNGAAYLTATGPPVVANQWHHVVGAIHYGGLYLYINGVQYGGTAISYVNRSTSAPIIIGAAEAATELWQGKIARFAIYNGGMDAGFWNNHYKSALERTTRNVHMTSFSIPELKMSSYQTPREAINSVNSYHDWKTGVDARGAFIFQAPPTSPTVEIGDWPGAEFEDASAGSGEDIYNKAIVEATGPDDAPVIVKRLATEAFGSPVEALTSPAPSNSSFTTNTTGWTAGTSTITRDTVTFDTTPAAGRWDNTGASDVLGVGDTLTTTFTGTFLAGVTYTLALAIRNTNALPTTQAALRASFGHAASGDQSVEYIPDSVGAFTIRFISWQPTANRASGVTLTLTAANIASLGYCWIDSLALFTATPTVVDRRGFRRTKILPVNSSQTSASATQLADTFLKGHATTPFRGSATVNGDGARSATNGRPLHPSELLLEWGNRLRVSHHIDPDTGALGREGQIAEVSYTHATQQASVTLDNRRQNFEAFLGRLSAVTQASIGG